MLFEVSATHVFVTTAGNTYVAALLRDSIPSSHGIQHKTTDHAAPSERLRRCSRTLGLKTKELLPDDGALARSMMAKRVVSVAVP
jgi:hypothetical protein